MSLDSAGIFAGSQDAVEWQEGACATRHAVPPARMLAVVEPFDPDRPSLERYIGARFERAYAARVTHFCRHLLGLRDAAGRWQAAGGYTPAHGPLFLEQYLDVPVELALASGCGARVARDRVVEVGNLAATSAGMARDLIKAIGHHLHDRGYEWAVFTATRELRNSFRRLRLAPLQLARADPARLADGGAGWGSYYTHDPAVMGGRLAAALRRGLPR